MYESFFGLQERPFAPAPIAKRYFAGAAIEAARQSVARCIERAEGAALVVGPAGIGKTLLCQVLAEQFRGRLEVAQLISGRLPNRRALLQAILFELGLSYRKMEEGDLRLALIDHLLPRASSTTPASEGLLLIVDEAHTLPLRLMEELRLITNLARNGAPRVRLVLVGSPQLEERFASPKMESFNQRIAVRSYLESLDRTQTIEYVRHQIEVVGGQASTIFNDDALNAIYRATDGIPRLINQVCDHALLLAYAGGVRQLTAAGIEEAWADLQQLPTPWSSAEGAAALGETADIIEFGQLDLDAADDLPAAVPFPTASSKGPTIAQPRESDLENAVEFASADDDFEPIGSIQPEVELTFQSLSTPFHSFDEEEVVLDRYTSIERDALANRPLVRSAESQEIGAMLPSTSPMVAIVPTNWPAGIPAEKVAGKTDQSTGQFDFTRDTQSLSTSPADLSAQGQNRAVPSSQPTKADRAAEAQDDDMIVIEEPADYTLGAPKAPKSGARRREYRQLFAQLRQS